MDKRYQVFISSTFIDLQDERAKVQQAVMELECIPAGMEAFPAIDEEQFEFIKKVIDDCDYYLLVIGGRYGSVSNLTGLSYTEMEYDYAVSKGIRVIALLHKDPDSLPLRKSEQAVSSKKKLAAFREKVATGRLIKLWGNADELPGLVSSSLSKTMRTYPAIGWVRGNSVPSSELYKELNDVRKENDRLKEVLYEQDLLGKHPDIAGLEDIVSISGSYSEPTGYLEYSTTNWKVDVKWGDLFLAVAHKLLMHHKDVEVRNDMALSLSAQAGAPDTIAYVNIEDKDFEAIRIQFRALNLINIISESGNSVWSLTATGEQFLIINKAVRRG
jgi:hypothetical protein